MRAFRCQLPRVNEFYAAEPSQALLPPRLPWAQHEASLAKDPWKVVEHEADLKGARSCVGEPQRLREWEIVVEAADSPSQVSQQVEM